MKRDVSSNRGESNRGRRGRGGINRGMRRGGRTVTTSSRGIGVAKRGGTRGRGTPSLRGRGSGRGRGSRGGISGRGRSSSVQRQSRSRTPSRIGQQQNGMNRSRSRTRYNSMNNNSQQNNRLRSRSRSRSNIPNFDPPNPLMRSRSRSRSMTRQSNVNQNVRSRSRSRSQNRFNGQQQQQQFRRSRSRTPARNVPKTGIAARLGNNAKFMYSKVGLRSDMILARQNQVRSRTFTRSGSVPKTQNSYTISVANDRLRRKPINRRRNSFPNVNSITNYLNQSELKVNLRSQTVRGLRRGRGRGRGRGGIGYVNRQILNPQLQMEIAALQGKTYQDGKILERTSLDPSGINFIPTPHLTTTKLSDRFNSLL